MTETNTTAIAEYSPTAAALADIAKRMAKVVYDVSTPAGMEAAKKDRKEVRDLRVALEHKRVEIKAPALKRCNEIDTEAARIKAELLKYEAPPDEAIKAEEQRIENERLAKVKAEEERQRRIQENIDDIRSAVNGALRAKSSTEVARILADINAIPINEKNFGDQQDAAGIAKSETVAELERIRDEFVTREQAAAQLAAERAELDRQRAEQAERDRTAREREEAERKRKADIEERIRELRGCQTLTATSGSQLIEEHLQDLDALPTDASIFGEFTQQAVDAKTAGILRLAALLKAAKEHEAEQERAAAQRAENERIAAEQREAQAKIDAANRELEARQQAERDAKAKRDREAAEAEEARLRAEQEQANKERMAAEDERRRNYRPTFDEIVSVLIAHYDRDGATVRTWIAEPKAGKKAA